MRSRTTVSSEAAAGEADQGSPAPPKSSTARPRRASRIGDVDELKRAVYGRADLSVYRFKDRLIIRLADLFFFVLIGVICRTVRWEVTGTEHFDSILSGGKRAIITFWHSCIFSGTWFFRGRGIVVMSSKSRDGEFTGRLIRRFGYGTARGSSTRGAGRALVEMSACLDKGIDVAFSIDGPRGPAFIAKDGAVTLARHTGHAILPFHVVHRRFVELGTWDRMRIPLPFSRCLAAISAPIYVPHDASQEVVASKQAELQSALDRLRLLNEM